MYRLKSIKYLTTTALITALLVVLSYATQFIRINNTKGILQLADGFFLALIILIRGPMLLICGILYSGIIDLISGAFIFIPVTIIIRILMFCLTYFLTQKLSRYVAMLLSSLMLYLYVLYTYLCFGMSFAILELVNDSIQLAVCYIIGVSVSLILERVNKKSNYYLWNDAAFDQYQEENTQDFKKE